jgi:hypothetical protein
MLVAIGKSKARSETHELVFDREYLVGSHLDPSAGNEYAARSLTIPSYWSMGYSLSERSKSVLRKCRPDNAG